MPEANGNWWYWGQSSKFVPAWNHIGKILEDQGALQYATLVWIPFCEGVPQASDPERFYPGDKYVDWIGLSAFSKAATRGWNLSFEEMITKTYNRMLKDHRNKPLMQGEFGRTNAYDQARWLTNAFKNIKNDFPALRAAICFGFVGFGDDSTLNEKSLRTLGDIFKDPYWIMAK